VNFAFSEEQEQLRDFVRQFLENYSSETTVRELMETDEGYDPETWKMMADQLGLQSLIIPEEHGGQGFGYVELIVVLEEMGRVLLCAPFFSTVILAANTLIHGGDDEAAARVLPGIASGETIATLAFTEENGRWDEEGIEMEATADGDGWTLSGTKMYVLDGHLADVVLVAARTPGGVSIFEVAGDADGLTRTALATMDLTRKQARLQFDNVAATLIGTEGAGWSVLERVLDLAAVALAAEQVGGAQVCLDTAVQYAKDRIQFGRPIGSFQAIKHKCADMLLEVEAGAQRSSTTNCRRSPRSPRPTARRPTSTPPPRTSRSTVASASPGSTRPTCTSSGPRAPSCCSATRPTTGNCSPSASASEPRHAPCGAQQFCADPPVLMHMQ
jgi:alkylation response protein AidB-like acyl-CoA dehydrogenase